MSLGNENSAPKTMPDSQCFALSVRVRYVDTDCGGVVYHANYLNYFEWARTELLRNFGQSYRDFESSGVQLVVTEAQVEFHRPAYYDDMLRVLTKVTSCRGASLEFSYEITRQEGEKNTLVCTGNTTLACINTQTRRPCRLPKWTHELLSSAR